MDESPTLLFFDPRYGDTYHVELDSEGEFVSALRYTSSVRPPIFYSHLGDIPQPHRSEIKNKILKWSEPTK